MCGRFGFFELKYFIDKLRQLELPFEEYPNVRAPGRYNIAPDTDIIALLGDHGRYNLRMAHWGMIPHWAKELPKVRPINARAETLAVKPYFRHMLHRNHCIIPASGFYEWQRSAGTKNSHTTFTGVTAHLWLSRVCGTPGSLRTKRHLLWCRVLSSPQKPTRP